jgi:hypothetical protein
LAPQRFAQLSTRVRIRRAAAMAGLALCLRLAGGPVALASFAGAELGVCYQQATVDRLNPTYISPEEGRRRVAEIRRELREDTGAEGALERRNIAILRYEVYGGKGELVAVSGQKSPPGTVPLPEDLEFTTLPTYRTHGDRDRSFDSEVKLLEHFAKRFSRESKGSVSLYTERSPCFSCQAVIQIFRGRYPGIRFSRTYGEPSRRER